MTDRGMKYWLGSYIYQALQGREQPDAGEPIDIMVCRVDHYEPFNGKVSAAQARERVNAWVEGYPRAVASHRDADGITPQYTWFYPPHLDPGFLDDLLGLCGRGFGEIEMHLHHNHMKPFPDTSETLRAKILTCVDDYARRGKIFCLPDGSRRFAFIHGDWSLDNSCGPEICGVNDEIRILKECGCYADMTFPSLGKAQPRMINTVYYCADDPAVPKSYDAGIPLIAGGRPSGDLMMIPGILGIRWSSRTHRFKPSVESSNIDETDLPTPGRIDYWVKNAVSVQGCPNWRFIKVHAHGARECAFDSLIGASAAKMFSHLETTYNDGKKYRLHYVTARELYNIIKAAEAGKTGDPHGYRDFCLPRYVYLPTRVK